MSHGDRERVGPWILGERLGRGGNASVWRATQVDDDAMVALKVINTKRVDREPYQRFVREIAFLRDHQAVPGLLPLLEAHLPDTPTNTDRPWLAMPIATPIAEALDGRGLDEVVAAVATIADTLWVLQRDFDIAHRDIKPGNLYELDGLWLIGDFGLVALPDTDGLTAAGRPLGPAHYTAYEMILDPSSADPHPADVYSLAKTLWVLATEQRFPPEGHQPAGTRRIEIGEFRAHARAGVLDQEIDLMTRLHPEDRPSKEQVARDLAAWQQLAAEPVLLDVSEARSRLRAKLSAAIAEQDTQAQQKELWLAAIRRLQELTRPLNEAIKELSSRAELDSQSDKMTTNILKSLGDMGTAQASERWQRCTKLAPLGGPIPMLLRMSRCLELFPDGMLRLHLMIDVGPDGVMGSQFNWHRPTAAAQAGTVEAEQMLADGVREMADALRDAIDVLVEQLPQPGGAG